MSTNRLLCCETTKVLINSSNSTSTVIFTNNFFHLATFSFFTTVHLQLKFLNETSRCIGFLKSFYRSLNNFQHVCILIVLMIFFLMMKRERESTTIANKFVVVLWNFDRQHILTFYQQQTVTLQVLWLWMTSVGQTWQANVCVHEHLRACGDQWTELAQVRSFFFFCSLKSEKLWTVTKTWNLNFSDFKLFWF